MRHRRKTKYFSRKTKPRKALLKSLVTALIEHGRIKTTLAKAKELRRHVERAITAGKKDSLHARRTLLAKYPNQGAIDTIMKDLAPRFKERPGGYTRIMKISSRPGDAAPQAFIEFVDYDATVYADKKVTIKVPNEKRKLVAKEFTKKELVAYNTKKNAKAAFATMKNNRRKQKADRRVLRAGL
ncbi:MAG: 50S ribosomal protein L17 [Bdellovibrionaceae bacterium]|nr:50S ribosomal protein L17 [Pseudobdellovibrionaceae bacterium]